MHHGADRHINPFASIQNLNGLAHFSFHTLLKMTHLTFWLQNFQETYHNNNDNFAVQEQVLRAITDRLDRLKEEHNAWSQLRDASPFLVDQNMYDLNIEATQTEIGELTRCLEHIRDYHREKADVTRRRNALDEIRIQVRGFLLDAARRELVKHQCEEQILNYKGSGGDESHKESA